MSKTLEKSSCEQKNDAKFAEVVKTETESVLYMKKLTAIAVSSLLYMRGIFDEDAYGVRYHEDIELRILSERSNSTAATETVELLKGAFDALSKGYLKEIVLGIYADPNKPNDFLEAYTFKFFYDTDNCLNFSYNNKEICTNGNLNLRAATKQFFQKLNTLTSSISALPTKSYLTMKLYYYDNTPPNYEPPGFKRDEDSEYRICGEKVSVNVGHVSTKYHILKLKMATEKRSIGNEAMRKRSLSSGSPVDENKKPKVAVPLPMPKRRTYSRLSIS